MTPCITRGPLKWCRFNNFSIFFCLVAGEKAIVCDQCGAQFQKEDALEAHRQIHTGATQTPTQTAHIKHTQMFFIQYMQYVTVCTSLDLRAHMCLLFFQEKTCTSFLLVIQISFLFSSHFSHFRKIYFFFKLSFLKSCFIFVLCVCVCV